VLQLRDEDVARAIGQVVPGQGALTDLVKLPPVTQTVPTSASAVQRLLMFTPRSKKTVKPKLSGVDHDRRKVLKWLGYGGGAAALAVFGKAVLDFGSFDVVTVNEQGKEVSRQKKRAKSFVEDLGNGVTLEMVSIPVGTFQMGSPTTEKGRRDEELPQHSVNVSAFSMGQYAVTQTQYESVMGQNPSNFKGAKRPVERVLWDDAQKFCEKLSRKTGRTYRLPSEAEWEYACRAGTTTPFHFGETLIRALANYNTTDVYQLEPKEEYRGHTTDVGIFPANAFGLYDMHGNVWEWCEDVWHKNYEGAPKDGSAWVSDDDARVLRGGAWLYNPMYCRSASRSWSIQKSSDYNYGFRVVCSSP
jgi:formylglycine-generating enzyme required for sulfatase activity